MMFLLITCSLCLSICCIFTCRAVYLIWKARRKRASFEWPHEDESKQRNEDPSADGNLSTNQATSLKTLIVLGSGGHTSEMIQLIRNLPSERYHPLVFVKAATDTTSLGRLQAASLVSLPSSSSAVHNIPRAREVGQSYLSSVCSTFYAFVYAIQLMARVRPDVLLCNGPGTCLPLCVAAFGWRVVGLSTTRIIFVESYCRVQTMSLTGRLLYAWVDLVAVHWPTLHAKYPLVQCTSTMIPRPSTNKKEQ